MNLSVSDVGRGQIRAEDIRWKVIIGMIDMMDSFKCFHFGFLKAILYQFGQNQKNNFSAIPANIYLFKVNNRNIRKRCEICSKLTIKTPARHQHDTIGDVIEQPK